VKLRQALEYAGARLRDTGIEDAPLEGEVLLRHVLGLDRARLFSHLDEDMSHRQEEGLERVLERRRQGEPVAYITGHREFYGLDFIVNRNVLIPRPETELLVEKAIDSAREGDVRKIADIGTGSGAIAVSLAVNLPAVTVYATDISARALAVAGKNCRRHGVSGRVVLLRGDLLEPLPGPVDLIIANLPYVRAVDLKAGSLLSYEPALALDGGEDGLDGISIFCRGASSKLRPGGGLMLEVGQGQAENVRELLRKVFPGAVIETGCDLAGIERMVSLRLTSGKVFC
jgi:release factor glutamine methyltransferase